MRNVIFFELISNLTVSKCKRNFKSEIVFAGEKCFVSNLIDHDNFSFNLTTTVKVKRSYKK